MDEKLREILSVQPLQEEVINCRTNGQLIRKIIKQTCIAEVKKLQSTEISIAEKELKVLEPEKWIKCNDIEEPHFDLEAMVEDCERTAQAMDFLK